MKEKDEIMQKLEALLQEGREESAEVAERLSAIKEEMEKSNHGTEYSEYYKASQELENSLDENGKHALAHRNKLSSKIGRCKWLGFLLFVVLGVAAVVALRYLDVSFSGSSIFAYLGAFVVAIILAVIFTKLTSAPYLKELGETRSIPSLIEYDKKLAELSKECSGKINNRQEYLKRLRTEESELLAHQRELKETMAEIVEMIGDVEFTFAYRDTILFYGCEKGNHYDLYLDGHLYDTVKGKNIVQIKLTPGIHSFRVENTCYNIVDGSVIYCYSFNTKQFVVGEKPQAFAIVCELKKIEQVTGPEFQRITKTQLV